MSAFIGIVVRILALVCVVLALLIVYPGPKTPLPITGGEGVAACAGLDLYYPPGDRSKVRRVALYIHGGSWTHGDRRSDPLFPTFAEALLHEGMAVASADYRFGTWPIELEDARCAVDKLREHFPEVVAWGGSAGGQIALMLAVKERAVGAAVSLAGPVDLTTWASEVFPDRRAASPLTWLDAGDPPVLVIVGDQDEYGHAGVERFPHVIVHGATHALDDPGMDPPLDALVARTVAFLSAPDEVHPE